MHFDNYDLHEAPKLVALRAARNFPSYSTCIRWIQIFNQTGDICPLPCTGNHHAEREVQGTDLKQLTLYCSVFPKATISECRAYLYNIDPTKDPYSNLQVHCAEKLLGLKWEAASTTADLAFLPQNMTLQEYYWTEPPLLGMRSVPIADIINIDEAGFFLEHSDRKFGKTILSMHCSQNGVYGHGEKVNLLLAICRDNAGRMRCHKQWMEGGTTIERFYGFIDHILDDLDQNHPSRSFVFTMGNLSAHRNPLVMNWILNAGHRYVFCAPYWPVDGAVEYVFNAIQSKLRIYFNCLETMDDLRNCINLTVGGIFSFYQYFEHVGFPVPP